jgi:hypothetical protein
MPHESASCVFVPDAALRLARVGPPTPKRATRLADASVDPTDARKTTVRRFGRSDTRATRTHVASPSP